MKYFGLGLSRTGTTSLFYAFQRLGFNSWHWASPIKWGQLDEYDFVNDLPVPARFEYLDSRYPGSKFVYNTRDVDSWVESCRKLEERLLSVKPYYDWMEEYHVEMYGATHFNEQVWRDAHARHDERVREYFANRPDDLLIMNIIEGDGYEKLIPFIGIDNIRFPKTNQSPPHHNDPF